jgi:hypothetical protein
MWEDFSDLPSVSERSSTKRSEGHEGVKEGSEKNKRVASDGTRVQEKAL